MPIVRQTPNSGPAVLVPEPFERESELERYIIDSPALLVDDGAPAVVVVKNQFVLPEAGKLDILLIDAEGVPIVAEAKLARNAQSRREIVGQVIDYVSALTALTVDELDKAVDGRLGAAIRSLVAPESSTDRFEQIWQAVGANLRAGQARYVVVLDEAPTELERIVRFLAARSNLDIALVTVTKYRESGGELILVPDIVVASEAVQEQERTTVSPPFKELIAVVQAYNASPHSGWLAVGRAPNYRQVRPPGWPGGLHYEFLRYAGGIGVELHLESQAALAAREAIRAFAGLSREGFDFPLEWDDRWGRNRGRLLARVPHQAGADAAAAAMRALIELTHARVAQVLPRREA